MTKVNIEGFVEVECKFLNEERMHHDNLTKSPGIKVQLFLNKENAEDAYYNVKSEHECTKIICERMDDSTRCNIYNMACQYNRLSI